MNNHSGLWIITPYALSICWLLGKSQPSAVAPAIDTLNSFLIRLRVFPPNQQYHPLLPLVPKDRAKTWEARRVFVQLHQPVLLIAFPVSLFAVDGPVGWELSLVEPSHSGTPKRTKSSDSRANGNQGVDREEGKGQKPAYPCRRGAGSAADQTSLTFGLPHNEIGEGLIGRPVADTVFRTMGSVYAMSAFRLKSAQCVGCYPKSNLS